MKTTRVAKDWKQRANDILRLFTSGSAFDLAEIVGSLTELNKTKTLSLRESWTLERVINFSPLFSMDYSSSRSTFVF
jgi:RNA polymerase-interacting CarD/CdnL/TRCF family regulator